MREIVEELIGSTKEYKDMYDKKFRKEKSQFFTPISIAHYMSELFDFNDKNNNELRILDPAGGTGILSLILLLHILNRSSVEKVTLDIYENDNTILQVLNRNMVLIKEEYREANRIINAKIYNENFITCRNEKKYDMIIGNPPYKKIKRNTLEAQVITDLLFGQPNLYMIYMVQSLKLLEDHGELVFIVPRSFFNGSYFLKFRKWLYDNYSITYIHSFESRNKIFGDEVYQELVVIKISNSLNDEIAINYSINDNDIERNKAFLLSSKIIWGQDCTKNLRLPINVKDLELLLAFDNINQTIEDLHLSFKTGSVVDFRVKEGLNTKKCRDCVPLIWCQNFSSYRINWPLPSTKIKQYISLKYNKNILLPIGNYILVKRFSSKEKGRSLNINILLMNQFEYDFIGIENHVNYLKFDNGTKEIMKGVFVLLKSTFYNRYFKIINGTTQINTTDLNKLPILSYGLLKEISCVDLSYDELTIEKCDNIIEIYFKI